MNSRSSTHTLLGLLLSGAAAATMLVACQGCRTTTQPQPQALSSQGQPATPPTLRMYVTSDVAGALEPCGCVKDQLGGLDHLAAWIRSEQSKAPTSLLVAAGPTFFMDPVLKDDHKAQDLAKAHAIARGLKELGLAAIAPGENDWAAGPDELARLAEAAGAPVLGANLPAEGPVRATTLKEVAGIKVGLIGLAGGATTPVSLAPRATPRSPQEAVKAANAELRKQGAQVVVVLGAVGRGEAKRIADVVPDLTAIVVGSPGGRGEDNTETPPAERIGEVVIAQTGNHIQTAVALDLHVVERSFAFQDGTGLAQGAARATLARRVDELRGRIAQYDSRGPNDAEPPPNADIEERRADLKRLEAELAAVDAKRPQVNGSFFRYTVQEVRENLGKDPGVTAQMNAYYKEVNERNKVLFAGKKPRPAAAGEPSYVGVEACTPCHAEPRKVWDQTAHARAYATLSRQFKEFNLDCVSCHVTGYDLPGGSTVTHVAKLENVGCEVCHGPGSLHAKNPKVHVPIPEPKDESCKACHHPPHVHVFDAKQKMTEILGPGHGL